MIDETDQFVRGSVRSRAQSGARDGLAGALETPRNCSRPPSAEVSNPQEIYSPVSTWLDHQSKLEEVPDPTASATRRSDGGLSWRSAVPRARPR